MKSGLSHWFPNQPEKMPLVPVKFPLGQAGSRLILFPFSSQQFNLQKAARTGQVYRCS